MSLYTVSTVTMIMNHLHILSRKTKQYRTDAHVRMSMATRRVAAVFRETEKDEAWARASVRV